MRHVSHQRHLELFHCVKVAISERDSPEVLDYGLVLFHRVANRRASFGQIWRLREVAIATVNTYRDRVEVFRTLTTILVSCCVAINEIVVVHHLLLSFIVIVQRIIHYQESALIDGFFEPRFRTLVVQVADIDFFKIDICLYSKRAVIGATRHYSKILFIHFDYRNAFQRSI